LIANKRTNWYNYESIVLQGDILKRSVEGLSLTTEEHPNSESCG